MVGRACPKLSTIVPKNKRSLVFRWVAAVRVDHLDVSPDGRFFVAGVYRSWFRIEKGLKYGYGGEAALDLYDLATGKRVKRLLDSPGSMRPAVYTADGNLIVTGANGATIPGNRTGKIDSSAATIDPLTGTILRKFTDRPDGVNGGHAAALSADGRALFRGREDGGIDEFEVTTGQYRRTLKGHRDMSFSLSTAATDSRRLLSGSKDTTALVWDVGVVGVAKFGKPNSKSDPADLWDALGHPDGEKGFAAMADFAADPAFAVKVLAERMKPARPGPDAASIAKLVADLDNDRFAVRESAAKKLDELGEAAVPAVRAKLEKTASTEVATRLTRFLERFDGPPSDGDKLRQARAIELLEHLDTPAALELLKSIAAGGPAHQTTHAGAAAKRIAARR